MREVTRTVYEAFDGSPFDKRSACVEYERSMAHMRLIGLTEHQLQEALTGQGEIADAIMTVAYGMRHLRPKAVRKDSTDSEPYLPSPVGPNGEEQVDG